MWYTKFLNSYGVDYRLFPSEVMAQTAQRIARLQSDQPLVSVVVIAYNEEQHLPSCLWSLSLTQSRYPIEIIGIDNNSSDATAQIFQDSGVRYFREERQGHGHARNRGLSEARGQYYICIDSDSLYPPHYVETLVRALERGNAVAVVGSYGFIENAQASRLSLDIYEAIRDFNRRIITIKRPESAVRGSVFGFRTDLARAVGGFRTDIKRGEDGSLGLALKKYGKIRFLYSASARAVTSFRSLQSDGTLFNALMSRVLKQLKNAKYYFYKKQPSECKDEESNLIK